MVTSFKELIVWQKAMELVKEVYSISKSLPQEELYSLSSQIKRSAISIPSNIAEGHKRGTKDYMRFLTIAYGSSAELETQLILCNSIYSDVNVDEALKLVIEVEKILSTIIKKIKSE
jgi:four helix bundle protein